MSRLSSRFDQKSTNSEIYIRELREFDNFEYVMEQIKYNAEQHESKEAQPDQKDQTSLSTLKYLLNVVENITAS